MAQSSGQVRPRRVRRIRYLMDDSELEEIDRPAHKERPSRAARRVQTYRESSDEDISLSSSDESEPRSQSHLQTAVPKLRRSTRQHFPVSDQPRKRKALSAGDSARNLLQHYKGRKVQLSDRPSKPVTNVLDVAVPDHSGSERSVPWQQLPYHVLVSIMQYAAYPLYSPASRANATINWLCSVSRLCRSFHEACISALLYSPPLFPSWRAHGLIRLLKQSPERLMTEYKRKICYLEIEAKELLIKKSGISIDDLVSLTPQLRGVRVYSNDDDLSTLIWALPSAQKLNWSYPSELFDRFNSDGLSLRSFEWNGRFPNAIQALETAVEIHSRSSFRRLRQISFFNISLPEKTTDVEHAQAQSLLVKAIRDLPELQAITLRNCSIVDEVTLSLLPPGIIHLHLAHCSGVTSKALEQYLGSCGSTLVSLKLDGNQSMSLGFMADLKAMCPKLNHLEVDMLYIDPSSFHDRDPLYDELLPNGPPTWPSALVTISVENLRQLSTADAEEFFTSLVDSAEHLPHLKKLSIKAILKGAGWRDRARLRKTWLPRLENTFLNTAQPNSMSKSENLKHTSRRQSSRIANGQLRKQGIVETTEDSDVTSSRPVQARCDVVNLVISDQRPAQDQFDERDFLDDEPSDDGEWDERNSSQHSSTGYAW